MKASALTHVSVFVCAYVCVGVCVCVWVWVWVCGCVGVCERHSGPHLVLPVVNLGCRQPRLAPARPSPEQLQEGGSVHTHTY